MATSGTLIDPQAAVAIGWALAPFAWGAALGVGCASVFLAVGSHAAVAARHLAAIVALALMAPSLTGAQAWHSPAGETRPAAGAPLVARGTLARAGAGTGTRVRMDRSRERRRLVWSNGRERLEISYDGEIEFTDDDTDVKSLSPGGYLKVSDGGWFGGRAVEFRADDSGAITRRYRVSIVEKPFEPEGRAWLARKLPRFVRESGLGAAVRVARLLKAGGPAGVFAEIDRIEGGHGKRAYLVELFKTRTLDPAIVRKALAQASREIESDYELASLLIASVELLADEATARSYLDASSTIASDYELHRVLSTVLKGALVTPTVLAGILTSAASIDSDYELASLLVEVAKTRALDATSRAPFFAALNGVEGDYEHSRVLSALAERADLPPETLVAMLRSSAGVGSDYEQAQFLLKVARRYAIDAAVRAPFFAAADQLGSSFERGRVLEAVVRRPDTDARTLAAALRSAASMAGVYESSQVLLAAAASHQISGAARAAYLDAAERLSDHEQGQVMRALMRSETRK